MEKIQKIKIDVYKYLLGGWPRGFENKGVALRCGKIKHSQNY